MSDSIRIVTTESVVSITESPNETVRISVTDQTPIRVITSIAQGPPGTSVEYSKTNAEAFTIQKGQPVRLSGDSSVVLADASSIGNFGVGVANVAAGTGTSVTVRSEVIIELADWNYVTGTTLLTVNEEYYLGQVPGSLTISPADITGAVLQYYGRAITNRRMHISVQRPILL
jgi:hypothetical protein